MRVAVFSTKPYDRRSLEACNAGAAHELTFIESRLGPETARLAQGFAAVCVFVNDIVDARPWRRWRRAAPGWWRCAAPASTMSTSLRPSAWRSPWRGCRPTRRMRFPSSPSA